MDTDNPLVDGIRNWFERTPRAQRAYRRLSADLDTLVDRVDAATSELRQRIDPILDPPDSPPAAARTPTVTASDAPAERGDAEQASDPVIPESESSVPPGVKRGGEPIDPTT